MNFLSRFSKNSRIRFNKNVFSGSQVLPCGRRDRQTWRS